MQPDRPEPLSIVAPRVLDIRPRVGLDSALAEAVSRAIDVVPGAPDADHQRMRTIAPFVCVGTLRGRATGGYAMGRGRRQRFADLSGRRTIVGE